MPVTVNFRGPILFVHDGNRSIDVRIPDCSKTVKHLDNEDAEPHSAGILLLPSDGGAPQYFDLDAKCELTITDTAAVGTSKAHLQATFGAKVALDKLVSAGGHTGTELRLGPADSPALLVRIALVGGQLGASNATLAPVAIPYRLGHAPVSVAIPLLTTWTCAGGATIMGGPTHLDLVEGDEVYFYNWEDDRPTPDALETPMPAPGENPMRPEADFKWLYTLLVPPTTWPEWIQNVAGGALPAPNSTIVKPYAAELMAELLVPDILYPPNSACDGAKWQEPPP
ncbi:MAG: hypothetical protein ABJE47_22135 [bacterium]